MKTKYESVSELEDQFDKYWVPCKSWDLGTGESGVKTRGIIDKKSERIYLEKYDAISDSLSVQAFDKGNYPERWPIDEDGTIEVEITVP